MRFRSFVTFSIASSLILFFCTLFFSQTAAAQTTALNISVTPKFPGPFETVTINVEDFSRDLNRTNIIWSVNNKIEEKGIGIKTHQIKTGALGSTSNISIDMGGAVKNITIRPTATDLIWQADTYTPPFYPGKALHSNQDPITVVAEPYFIDSKGARLDPSTFVYRWKLNGEADSAASGYGKRIYKITPSILIKPNDVSVEVTTSDETYKSGGSITINDTRPEILFYEKNPIYGINFGRTLNDKDFIMTNDETTIVGEPFFFSNAQKNTQSGLTYTWTQNGTTVQQEGNELTFRKPEDQNGRAQIGLGIKNLERFMQFATGNFYVQFNNNTNIAPASQPIF